MLLIFGGTTEGRIAAKVAEEAEKPFIYCTHGPEQEIELVNGQRHVGPMEVDDMLACIAEHQIEVIVDAAHPFAKNLHANIAEAARRASLKVIRLERTYCDTDNLSNVIQVKSYDEALTFLASGPWQQVLFLTGLHTIPVFKPYWSQHPQKSIFRVLDRDSSRAEALSYGIGLDQLIYFKDGSDDEALYNLTPVPDLVVSKESGSSGYFENKIKFASAVGAKLLVVGRPSLPEDWVEANGPHGLRLAIERIAPSFFELHCGYTTGSCATAATRAALLTLCGEQKPTSVNISLPNGEQIAIPIHSVSLHDYYCIASVMKMSGDDPDVTNGEEICAKVRRTAQQGITFCAGQGVGTVTLPGLGLPIGGPAINKVPREMMTHEIVSILGHEALKQSGVEVEISVPNGEELAKKTFNPRLGVEGGISIIGTSGIVKPFSHEAFVSSIKKEMQVAMALGEACLILNSGARSVKTMKELFPHAIDNAFIHYGNYIGDTLALAEELEAKEVAMGLMIGKAIKLAEGHANTHSKKVQMNKDFITQIAVESGCDEPIISAIEPMVMARELLSLLPPDANFYQVMMRYCMQVCRRYYTHGKLTLYLIHDDGSIVTQVSDTIPRL